MASSSGGICGEPTNSNDREMLVSVRRQNVMTKTRRCMESKENSYNPRLTLNNGVNGVNDMAGKAVTVAVERIGKMPRYTITAGVRPDVTLRRRSRCASRPRCWRRR